VKVYQKTKDGQHWFWWNKAVYDVKKKIRHFGEELHNNYTCQKIEGKDWFSFLYFLIVFWDGKELGRFFAVYNTDEPKFHKYYYEAVLGKNWNFSIDQLKIDIRQERIPSITSLYFINDTIRIIWRRAREQNRLSISLAIEQLNDELRYYVSEELKGNQTASSILLFFRQNMQGNMADVMLEVRDVSRASDMLLKQKKILMELYRIKVNLPTKLDFYAAMRQCYSNSRNCSEGIPNYLIQDEDLNEEAKEIVLKRNELQNFDEHIVAELQQRYKPFLTLLDAKYKPITELSLLKEDLENALQTQDTTGVKCDILYQLARIATNNGDDKQAKKLIEEAVNVAKQNPQELILQLQTQAALLKFNVNNEVAFDRLLEFQYKLVESNGMNFRFQRQLIDTPMRPIRYYLGRQFRDKQSKETLYHRLEQFKLGWCSRQLVDSVIDLKETIHHCETSNTIFVHYLLPEDPEGVLDAIHVMLISADGVRSQSIALDEDIRDVITAIKVRRVFDPQGPETDDNKRLQKLYNVLIQPIYESMKSRSVVLIPDDVLWHVPWFGLKSGDAFLIEDTDLSISWSPSVTVYFHCRSRCRKLQEGCTTSRKEGQFLSFICPQFNTNINPVWKPITYADGISKITMECLPDSTITIEDTNPNELKKRMSRSPLVHLVTHGSYSGSLMLGPTEEWLPEQAIMDLKESSVQLMTLSACWSNFGVVSRDGTTSFATHALAAGITSIVCTVWPAGVEANKEVFETFYSFLLNGHTKSEALQKAVRLVSKTKPFLYWASFILLGDTAALSEELRTKLKYKWKQDAVNIEDGIDVFEWMQAEETCSPRRNQEEERQGAEKKKQEEDTEAAEKQRQEEGKQEEERKNNKT
jgi:CHAT domain-containing protein